MVSLQRLESPHHWTRLGGYQLLHPTLGGYILQDLARPVQVVVEVAEVVEGLQDDREALNTFLLPENPTEK